MRWMLAGLLFAMAVALAVGTVAIRSDNVHCRRQLEADYRALQDRVVEARRASIRLLQESTPDRLAAALRAQLRGVMPRTPGAEM